MSPRRHLRNLISSRTSNRRALRVMWAWLQGAKRGLIPEIPPEFILLSKLKHAKALQKVLPEIPADFLADFKHDLKKLWRGVDRISVRSFRDAEGNLKTGLVRQWKPNKAVRAWQGNPGWNACITSSRANGGKTQACREWIKGKIQEHLDSFVGAEPGRSDKILPKIPMSVIARWAREDIYRGQTSSGRCSRCCGANQGPYHNKGRSPGLLCCHAFAEGLMATLGCQGGILFNRRTTP